MLPCHVVARRFVIAPVQRMHGCTATSNYEQPNFSDFFRLLNLSKNKYAGPPDSRTKIYAARASCGSSSCMSIDICCPRPTSAANSPAAAAAVGGRDRRTDTRQFFLTHGPTISVFIGVPLWSVAVSTIRCQSVQSLAFLQAEWILMLTDCTSVSVALSQLARGRPLGLLQ